MALPILPAIIIGVGLSAVVKMIIAVSTHMDGQQLQNEYDRASKEHKER